MKKLLFVFVASLALLFSIDAHAQLVADAGFVVYGEKENKSYASNFRGVYLGAKYYYPLDDVLTNLSLVPGINVSLTGNSSSSIYSGSQMTEIALNIPLQAAYTYRLNDPIKIFALAGPTVQFGLSQKAVYKSTGYKTTLNCYQDNVNADARKRLDVFLGASIGMEMYDRYQIMVGYDLGLLQLSSNTNLMHIVRDMFRIGVGYRF